MSRTMTAPPHRLTLRLLASLVLLVPATAHAQTVVGRVAEEGTLRPLGGAFVVLEDADGRRTAAVLTGRDGRFVIRAGVAGSYRLRTQMIGYATTETDPFRLEPGETAQRLIQVPLRAVALDGIRVTGGARCRPRPGSGPETARLWEEGRKALEVASWTEKESVVRFHAIRHRSVLDPRTLRVVERSEEGWRGWSGRSPFSSIPAERLATEGYVRQAADGELTFYAPDADVLLSDLFLDSHCFFVRSPPADEPELIGLGFEPVRRGPHPDIRGVLWLDRGTAELRRLDFGYTAVPTVPAGLHAVAGGRVEFERLATGVWIVRRWWIRMPEVALRVGGVSGNRPEPILTAIHETGAEVRSATAPDGRPLAEAGGAVLYGLITADLPDPVDIDPAPAGPGSSVVGTVRGDDSGGPVAGALVRLLDPAGRAVGSAVSDGDGRFRVQHSGADAGFQLRVEHIAYGPAEGPIQLEPGGVVRVEVALSTRAIELDPIVVTERRRGLLADVGFYDRRDRGLGVFVEVDDAQRVTASRITDLLMGKPSIRVIPAPHTGLFGNDVRITGTERRGESGMSDCQPAIFLDGVLVRQAGVPRREDVALSEIISAQAVAAIEVFRRPAEVPAHFGGTGASCGVVLVWSRRS